MNSHKKRTSRLRFLLQICRKLSVIKHDLLELTESTKYSLNRPQSRGTTPKHLVAHQPPGFICHTTEPYPQHVIIPN